MITKPYRSSESGNILIYILGAIVLLGVLVIMVKGSTTPGSGIDNEALALKVAEVQQYGMELERAVTYILRDGYSETDIRFAHPNHSSAYGNITDDPGRQVFARAGGGATWKDNDTDIQTTDTDWVFTGRNSIDGIGGGSSGTSPCIVAGNSNCTELIALLLYVSEDFCILVNNKNNITNPSDSPPQDDVAIDISDPFTGNFNLLRAIRDTPNYHLFGKTEGCFEGDVDPPSGTYHYFRVLLAR